MGSKHWVRYRYSCGPEFALPRPSNAGLLLFLGISPITALCQQDSDTNFSLGSFSRALRRVPWLERRIWQIAASDVCRDRVSDGQGREDAVRRS
ncbi:predicted protein [Plenodomus lingam JN3]|uniref:Predicted protein n=1 Tax=Leptosphaeria maculans (strain JN3 / isolate v23.1.3 / race Av1-4-5-6-7-8) TaxID=985895 RepID=E4ZIG3_LEPMJ|nr:predicted protein [Plenodomus lingam JN3]CBX90984.1 predicted protein [Plenodomus lingam JN3]